MDKPNKPTVRLVGEDGNVFNVIGLVKRALVQNKQPTVAQEWVRRATSCHSYDEVLQLVFEYCEVE